VAEKKPKEQGEQQRRKPAKTPDAHSVEVAFDKIIDAILGAKPEALREHRERRKKSKSR
jgi:hypothetical protein